MKRAEDFRRAMGNADAGFDAVLRRTLTELQAKEEPIVKRKVSVGLVLALVLVLATVTALSAGVMPGILELLFGQEKPEVPSSMVQALEGMQTHTKYASFTVREMLYDGHGAYMAIDLTPRNEQILLVPDTLDKKIRPGDKASLLGLADAGKETIEEYAARTGKTMVYVSLYADTENSFGFSSMRYADLVFHGDGTWSAAQRIMIGGPEVDHLKLQFYTLRLALADELTEEEGLEAERVPRAKKDSLQWVYAQEPGDDTTARMDLPVGEPLAPVEVRHMVACEEAVTLRSVRVHDVTVTRTAVAVYLDVACELQLERETDFFPGIFLDETMMRTLDRTLFIREYEIHTEGNIAHASRCYTLDTEIPDVLWIELITFTNSDKQPFITSRQAGVAKVTLK